MFAKTIKSKITIHESRACCTPICMKAAIYAQRSDSVFRFSAGGANSLRKIELKIKTYALQLPFSDFRYLEYWSPLQNLLHLLRCRIRKAFLSTLLTGLT